MKKIKVHPLADRFPMLPEDELEELARDIKENGQAHPCVLDRDGLLIDGRNRLEACRRAGIEPMFATLPEESDPVAYIISANVHRRMLTKGAQAMAVAIARPEPETAGRKKAGNAPPRGEFLVSSQKLSDARLVLRWCPELEDRVLSGESLKEAHNEAVKRRDECASREQRLARLRQKNTELAEKVDRDELILEQAEAALRAIEDTAYLRDVIKKKREVLLQKEEIASAAPLKPRLPTQPIIKAEPSTMTTPLQSMIDSIDKGADDIEGEGHILDELMDVIDRLKDIEKIEVYRSSNQAGFVTSIYNIVSHIIYRAYEINEKYQETLKIKSVK